MLAFICYGNGAHVTLCSVCMSIYYLFGWQLSMKMHKLSNITVKLPTPWNKINVASVSRYETGFAYRSFLTT